MPTLKPHKTPISVTHPDLANEWDYKKNAPLTPDDVTFGVGKKFWWKCEYGHEWEVPVCERTRGRGCPVCAKQKRVKSRLKNRIDEKGSINTTHPELAAEWHPTKNGTLSPADVTAGSGEKVWWVCTRGHEWCTAVYIRTSGSGCPQCSALERTIIQGKRRIQNNGSLVDINPLLAKQWNFEKNTGLSPREVSPSSGKKVWWKCEKGHEWEASICNRNKGSGCPYCSGHCPIVGETDLATVKPLLATQWNTKKNGKLKPTDVTSSSHKKVWWQCVNGHEWQAPIHGRADSLTCPVCMQLHKQYTNEEKKANSLLVKYPSLFQELHPQLNEDVNLSALQVSSTKKVWWKCSGGHTWQSSVKSRVCGKTCPICTDSRAAIVKETIRNSKDIKLIDREPINKERSLLACFPEIAREWHPTKNGNWLAKDASIGTPQKAWWKCPRGHEYEMRINSRTGPQKCGCPYCSGHRVLEGVNDLQTLYPELAKEWHSTKNGSLSPSNVRPGSNKRVWWICEKRHEWQASIQNRAGGNGCPYCSSERKSSFPEQTVFYYVLQVYKDAQNRWLYDSYEIDIFIPSLNVGIEYDGQFFHNTTASSHREERKNSYLKSKGIRLIRIKENNIENRIENDVIYYKYDYAYKELRWAILSLFTKIDEAAITPDINIVRDRSNILQMYISMEKKNSLEERYPEIAVQWNYEKNGMLEPRMFSYASNKIVWWKCDKGHEWESSIAKRTTLGRGCPICSNRKLLSGYNDLSTTNPILAAQWHPTKNGSLFPSDVSYKSNKKVWWHCFSCGKDWCSQICNRTSGKGCPHCIAEKRTSFPEQAVYYYLSKQLQAENRYRDSGFELDIFLPDRKIGVEYDGQYYHNSVESTDREKKKEEFYAKQGVQVIRIKEAKKNYISGHIIFYHYDSAYRNLAWAIQALCKLIDANFLPDVDIERDSSEIDALYVKSKKEKSLLVLFPDLIKEWNFEKNLIKPDMVYAYSNKRVWWRCSKGHNWQAKVCDRANGYGCSICSGKKVLSGYNDLLKECPDLAQEWNTERNGALKPSDVTINSNKKVWWKCSVCGHEWQTAVSNRSRGTGCPSCAGKIAVMGTNDLASLYPDIALDWHPTKNSPLTPSDVKGGSSRKVWWKCSECGHEWQAFIYSRTSGKGCPNCAIKNRSETLRKNRTDGKRTLKDKNPSFVAEWHPTKNLPLAPADVTPYSSKSVWWRCSVCAQDWESSISNRSLGYKCPFCTGESAIKGKNDLLTSIPLLAQEWNYEMNKNLVNNRGMDVSTPDKISIESYQKVWWRCNEGHEWQAKVCDRVNGEGCPRCKKARSRRVQCIETGVIYPSLTSAVRETGITSIPPCVRGRCKTAGGYHWKFYDN